MAHGEATRPIETTDGSTVDASNSLGNKSLYVIDGKVVELLEQVLVELKAIRLATDLFIEKEL